MEKAENFFKLYNEYEIVKDKMKRGEIYHYTSPEGLESILRNKKLHFTDRRFLNDKNESTYIQKFFYKNIDHFKNKMNCTTEDFEWAFEKAFDAYTHGSVVFYLCSFSLDRDNLSLWNYYTKSDRIAGYNIAFKIEKLIDSNDRKNLWHGKVVYSDKKKLEIINDAIDKLFFPTVDINDVKKESLLAITIKLIFISAFFKEECFKNENEYRIIITKNTKIEDAAFKVRSGIFVPYIEYQFPNEAVKSIGISPTIDKEMAIQSLETLLTVYDINQHIYFSKVPVRY